MSIVFSYLQQDDKRMTSYLSSSGSTLYQKITQNCNEKDPSYTGNWYCATIEVLSLAQFVRQNVGFNLITLFTTGADLRIIYKQAKGMCRDKRMCNRARMHVKHIDFWLLRRNYCAGESIIRLISQHNPPARIATSDYLFQPAIPFLLDSTPLSLISSWIGHFGCESCGHDDHSHLLCSLRRSHWRCHRHGLQLHLQQRHGQQPRAKRESGRGRGGCCAGSLLCAMKKSHYVFFEDAFSGEWIAFCV